MRGVPASQLRDEQVAPEHPRSNRAAQVLPLVRSPHPSQGDSLASGHRAATTMAKTRAQRKAERRAREARQARDPEAARQEEAKAQARTEVPESGEVAEVEAVIETGASTEELGEHVRDPRGDGATLAPEQAPEPEPEPEAPAPAR